MDKTVVQTAYGGVRGYVKGGLHTWKGIPYARAERFRHAQSPLAWDGVKDALRYGPACPQLKKQPNTSEDCLCMNIWSDGTQQKKPVMLFLHGGSFREGAASDREFDGAALAKEGVVVVTVNYRLGVLGFMDFSFMDEAFQPNCGLSDVVQAIRFVKENIAAFGGDPGNITVFGQSAGAIICSALPVMPAVSGDISKIIMMSGSPTLMHTKKQGIRLSKMYAEFMGVATAQALKALPAKRIAASQEDFASHCGLGAGTYAMEVDGDLLPGFPIPLAAAGKAGNIPMLIGTTREEMSFLFIKPFEKRLDIKGIFEAGTKGEGKSAKSDVPALYAKHGERGRGMMMADLVFRLPSVWYAGAYGEHNPTWMYRYDYESPMMKATKLHAFHSTDLPLIFGTYTAAFYKFLYSLTRFKPHFKKLSAAMRRDFVEFATTGALPWERCEGESVPACCYDREITVAQAVDDEIKGAFRDSAFRRRSMNGESNNLHDGA
mgnify:CR=1 FL=1